MSKVPDLALNNGLKIPQVGLGLWKVTESSDVDTAVTSALASGYTHFDSAQAYHNEDLLLNALNKLGVRREEVFITTKIATNNFFPTMVISSFEKSLKKLDTDYVDLLLLHFPVPRLRHGAWKKLEKIHEAGKARSIGVSNYTVRHLKKLLNECNVKPAVNQVELHVFLQQPELVEYCKQNDIVIEAYSPLAHGHGLDDPTLSKIAKKHAKSTAQIMLRWCVEQDFVVLPKSIHKDRIAENIDIFDFKLDDEDLIELKSIDKNYRTCWDPTNIP